MTEVSSMGSKNEVLEALSVFKSEIRAVGAFSMVINLLVLVPSLYMLQVYDRVLPSRNEYTLLMLTGLVLAVYAFSGLLEYVRSLVVIRVGERIDARLARRLHGAAFACNLRQPSGNAGQAIQDLAVVRQFATSSGVFAFFDAPWFPIYIGLIFFFNTSLGWFALAASAILVALAWCNEIATRKLLSQASQSGVASAHLATNSLRNAEVIHAMGMLPALQRRWESLQQQFVALQSDASQRAAMIGAVSRFVRTSQQSLVLGIGALLAIEGAITPGMMIAASILAGRAASPIDQLIGAWRQFSSARSAYQRLCALLADFPEPRRGTALPAPRGRIEVQSVAAVPPGAQGRALDGVSLELDPGEVLAVVGPSGCGKSTLARLLVGVWPAASGHVRLDGADVHAWDKEELGPSIGYLPQDVELFAGTITENIARFGAADAGKVIEASRLAGIHEMVLKLPQGYDTVLGHGGAGLSGGQQQRVALARALYGRPALLVLDEPNANLDEAGEKALAEAVVRMRQLGSTVVFIAHRGPVLKTCSKLLVLRAGKIHLFGARDAVLARLAGSSQDGPAMHAGTQPAVARGATVAS